MADISTMDLPTLQNMLNGAGSYEERAAIRKAIRQQKAAAAPAKGSDSTQPSSAYRRPGGRAGPSSGPSLQARPYQFGGVSTTSSSSSGSKATEHRGVKAQPRDTTPKPQRDSNSSHPSLVDNLRKPTGTGSSSRGLGLTTTSDLKSKDREQRASEDIPSPGVGSSKIEEAVTVVAKEEEDVAQESVDEVQIAVSDEIELAKNAGDRDEGREEQILRQSDEQSEVELDMVVTSGNNADAAPAVSEVVGSGNSSSSVAEQPVHEEPAVTQQQEQQQPQQSTDAESGNQSGSCELDDDAEEEALEKQIQSTLSYTERKELRAKLRQLRKNRKASRTSDTSDVSTSTDAAPRVQAKEPRSTPKVEPKAEEVVVVEVAASQPAVAEVAPEKPEISIEEVDSGCCLLAEGEKSGEVSPAVGSTDLSPVADYSSSQHALPSSEHSQDEFVEVETSSQASSASDSGERRHLRVAGGEEAVSANPTAAALGQSEGVADFRTVLRGRGTSPVPPRKAAAAGGEQKDFRTVLKKSDAPAPIVVGKAPKASEQKAEQKDFRGSLRRKVQTKDCSSAAPRRDAAAQEDFRTVLKKGEKEATATYSPLLARKEESAPVATPPVARKPVVSPPVVSPAPEPQEPASDEVDGLGSSRMQVTSSLDVEVIEMPAVASEAEPSVSVATTSATEASASQATRDLLAMDPLDASLSYDERREIRRLQREARRQGGGASAGASMGSPAKKVDEQTYDERRRIREEAKRQEEKARQEKRQQFAAKLEASSPQTSPTKVVQRSSGAQQLLQWCQRRTTHYENVEIKDFRGSWKNGLAFAALMSSLCPGDIPYDELTAATAERNLQLAFAASEKAGLTPMLDVEDMMMCRIPDEKSIMTYVSSIYKHFT